MFATWILCLFLLMIAPYLTLEAGILRKKKCAALGAGRGYRTELSMASQEAWDYAQQICSKRYMIAGILMAVAALLFIRIAPTDTLASLYVFTAVIALFEVVTVILLIASVEGKRGFHYAFPSSINAVSAASISSISVIAFTLTRSLAASRMPRT